MRAPVAVLRTTPRTVAEDYRRLMHLARYTEVLDPGAETLLKLNLSWTKYFPACSTEPWQLEGVVRTLIEDGFRAERLHPVENKTVVTNPRKGAVANRWMPILERCGLPFIPLPEVEWITYEFRSPLLKLNEIFPEGIQIPKMFVGKNVLHLPTVKCVHPDTEVLLDDGSLVRAEELVKELQAREPVRIYPDGDQVSEGEARVVSLGQEGLRGGQATHFWRTPVVGSSLWTVRTRTGRKVTISRIHPFLTPEGWERAEHLRVGDRVAIARRVRIEGKSQPLPRIARLGQVWATAPGRTSPEFWRWTGYFMADGHACEASGSYRISFTNTDPSVRADYLDLSRSLFGVIPRIRGNEIYFDAVNLRPFFEALGFSVPTTSGNQAAPDPLFRCPDREIAAFLQGYVDGDGTVGKDGVHVVTKSPRLAHQIQMLLSRLGVLAFVGTVKSRSTNSRTDTPREYWQVSVYGDDVITLAGWMRLRCGHKQRDLECLVARRNSGTRPSNSDTIPALPALFRMIREGLGVTHASSGKASEDIAWDWVEEVREEPAEIPFLYDLSVEGTHTFVGNGIILHNTHGHSVTTGAVKNSFGGLLKEVRHYAHEFIHEVMVDLMLMQRELHPEIFAVMDGTVMGDGAGPRTMIPRIGNLILASADSVAIDAVAARLMGYDPLRIPYLAMCHERGLGIADPGQIEVVGDDVSGVNFGFQTRRSLVIWGDQLIRKGPLRPLKKLLLHSPLVVWAPFASNVYHDWFWYPTVGRSRIRNFLATEWGQLFKRYSRA